MSLMLVCELKSKGIWSVVPATQIPRGTCSPQIRCTHCHGAIRVHKAWWSEHSIQDHFEHRVRRDSTGCRGGYYHDPKSEHQMAEEPIE